jgi:hypothetical protein
MMVLLAVVKMPVFLLFWGFAPWTHVSDDHGRLLTSTGWVSVVGSTGPQKSVGEHDMDSTTVPRARFAVYVFLSVDLFRSIRGGHWGSLLVTLASLMAMQLPGWRAAYPSIQPREVGMRLRRFVWRSAPTDGPLGSQPPRIWSRPAERFIQQERQG